MSSRYSCPNCDGKKTFALYIDTATGDHLSPTVGRCNRESTCGYHYNPKQYFQDNNISFDTPQPTAYKRTVTPQLKPVSFIPVDLFKDSLRAAAYETNYFVKYLTSLFGFEITNQLIGKYFIATSKHWNGATIFWQIDMMGKIRTGKIMLYSPTTGTRVKEPFNHIAWVHTKIKQPDYELKQCIFGEHLLKGNTKPVAIVESEKTAIVASVYLPQFIWLACGSLQGLNIDKCKVLKGRSVTLYPDLKELDKWKAKAQELESITSFTVSDLLERKASEAEKKKGFDLADYLIQYDYKLFIEPIAAIQPLTPPKVINHSNEDVLVPQGIYKLNIEQIKAIPYCKSINGIVVATLSMFDGKQYDTLCHNNTDQDFIIYGSLQNEIVAMEKELNVNFIPIDIGTGLIYGRETSHHPLPEPLPAITMQTLFVSYALKHYQRSGGKVPREKYFLAYSDSMATTLQQYGITPTAFLNQLN